MPAINLLGGIRATANAEFVQSYPKNLEPIALDSGLSKGQLRTSSGADLFATGPGNDRGGIVWNGLHYRVMGTKLVTLGTTGTITVLGDVGGSGQVALRRFDAYLAIRSGTALWYWNGTTLTQVTDPDLGPCIDVVRLNGQLFSTDGTYIVAANLSDPLVIDPFKYGQAETDPDGITGLFVIRNELYALGLYTIDVFSYTGGAGFPLSLSEGATIPFGCVGPNAKTKYGQSFAFVGGGENEAIGVMIAGGGTAVKISTKAIDDILAAEPNQAGIVLEKRVSGDEERLLVHLSDRSLCFYRMVTDRIGAQTPIWAELFSGKGMDKPYRPRNITLANGRWIVGDTESSALGVLTDASGGHFGEAVGWQFQTSVLFNDAKAFILHVIELVGLPGRGQTGEAGVFFSYSIDGGQTFSQEYSISLGVPFERTKRVQFRPHRKVNQSMVVRFRGDSSALAGWASLNAEMEALAA